MKTVSCQLLAVAGCALLFLVSCQKKSIESVTVPVVLDHNRMLIDAEIARMDGTWRRSRLWVDSGNPEFFMSEALALDLDIDLSGRVERPDGRFQALEVQPPACIRIGGMPLDFEGVKSKVMFQPKWLFNTMHIDANLPSTVLRHYQVVLDYPGKLLTLAKPGSLRPRGVSSAASIDPQTGIVQLDAIIDGDSISFALDNGASYSFVSDDFLARLSSLHPDWQKSTGAVGCANIWGWWPGEEAWPIMRIPEIQWGSVRLDDTGVAGLPAFFQNGSDLGTWYSQKTARPVVGFLGPNAFKVFRVEIDYLDSTVYFEKSGGFDSHDMDIVGLTLRPQEDGNYQVIGISQKDGKPVVEGVEPGDVLLQIDDLETTGATMGTVIDALRGEPGDTHALLFERNGRQFRIEARVERFLNSVRVKSNEEESTLTEENDPPGSTITGSSSGTSSIETGGFEPDVSDENVSAIRALLDIVGDLDVGAPVRPGPLEILR